MDFVWVIWVFFLISSLTPMIRQRMLETNRRRVIEQLEQKRRSRVIVLIHRQETLSLLGFPLLRYIDIDDSEAVLRAIKLTDNDVPIDLILHTPGGLVLASGQIAHALRKHPAVVTVFVPHYAMSGGTLIAMGADEIVMDDNAVLGPVDPQIGNQPAASIVKVLERKPIQQISDGTLILADIAEKALRQVKAAVADLLNERLGPERADYIATVLSSGFWTHDYPITAEAARELGLPVSTDMPAEIYQLMALYPQTAQRRPSVEYIPTPYGPPAPAAPRERPPATRPGE